ncbi:MAG: hypothetical protein ACK4SY_00225 [Pyrobaculum sp.]
MRWKIVTLAVTLTLAIAALQLAYAHGWRGGTPPGPQAYGMSACWIANTTLYVATRQVSIVGDDIQAAFTVDIVNRNASSPYGKVVYGGGEVTLGGVRYVAKSVRGVIGLEAARLVVYTGSEMVSIWYYNGRYVAIVKTFGKTGYLRYDGTATLNVS